MSTGDTIRTALEGYVSEGWCQESLDEGNAALAALSALLQERERMRQALGNIAWLVTYPPKCCMALVGDLTQPANEQAEIMRAAIDGADAETLMGQQ